MILDKDTKIIYDKLIDELYSKEESMNKKLKESDPKTLRKLGHFGDLGFTSDEILEIIDTSVLKRLQNLLDNCNNEELCNEINNLNLASLDYLSKLARKRKISEMVYKIAIGNLSIDDEEMNDSLELLNLKIDTYRKKLTLVPIDDNK